MDFLLLTTDADDGRTQTQKNQACALVAFGRRRERDAAIELHPPHELAISRYYD
jgi:hypothetical protein